MEYTKLGNTDITVSKICVGCMSFGKAGTMHDWTLDETATESVVRHALDLGINFFDTANGYSAGTSEEYLGRALQKNTQREKVVIASKVYFNPGRLSRAAIHREIDGTLRRLGTDYLDLYIIHRFDYETPVEETMEALNDLVQAGKVRALVRLPCMATSFIICSWRQRNMAGRSFRRWKTTIICCTGRTNGN
ncbi:MAG: aldo/keto reductase [Ruminococcus sp.]